MSAASTAKVSLLSLLIICLVSVVLSVAGSAGVLLYLAKHGKLGAASAPAVVEAKTKDPGNLKTVALEPMLINLSDPDGNAYLRLVAVLSEEVEKPGKEKEEKVDIGPDAIARDTVLDVVGRKHAADLLAPSGKDELKQELKNALVAKLPEAKVQAVYFTEFLVQR